MYSFGLNLGLPPTTLVDDSESRDVRYLVIGFINTFRPINVYFLAQNGSDDFFAEINAIFNKMLSIPHNSIQVLLFTKYDTNV